MKTRKAYRFVTYTCEGSKLLPFLMQQFRSKNGALRCKNIQNLEELAAEFDIIINCSGLGAKQLMNDELMHPIRGHIFRVSCALKKSCNLKICFIDSLFINRSKRLG